MMAKKKDVETSYVAQPKSDVYLAIMIITFTAMIIATGLMYLEYSSLGPG